MYPRTSCTAVCTHDVESRPTCCGYCVLCADLDTEEEAFPRPNEFIPERWTTKPELIADRSVYYPFSAGTSACTLPCTALGDPCADTDYVSAGKYSCVGKQLALVELRQVAVEVLRRYTVELAPGFTSRDFEGGLRDRFSMQAKRLDLVFKAR